MKICAFLWNRRTYTVFKKALSYLYPGKGKSSPRAPKIFLCRTIFHTRFIWLTNVYLINYFRSYTPRPVWCHFLNNYSDPLFIFAPTKCSLSSHTNVNLDVKPTSLHILKNITFPGSKESKFEKFQQHKTICHYTLFLK